jgi:hypothetical protein
LDFEEIIEQAGANAQATLDEANIFVASAEEAFDAFADLNACLH